MKLLPRSMEYRTGDALESIATRLAVWSRDVIAALRAVPDVGYVTVTIATGETPSITTLGTPRAVSVARVTSGTVSAAVGVDWTPVAGGFEVLGVYGVALPATLSLRVEV